MSMVDHVEKFVDEPWAVQPWTHARSTIGERYAHLAATENPKAMRHFEAAWDVCLKEYPHELVIVHPSSRKRSRTSKIDDEHKSQCGDGQSTIGDDQVTNIEDRQSVNEPGKSSTVDDRTSNVAGRPHPPAGPPPIVEGPARPEWATFQRDANVWYDELVEAGVDYEARRIFFALAQHSDRGYEEANRLIHKLFKDKFFTEKGKGRGKGKKRFENVSAFLSNGVMNARAEIDKEEYELKWGRRSWGSSWW